jgi:hypothetical protein
LELSVLPGKHGSLRLKTLGGERISDLAARNLTRINRTIEHNMAELRTLGAERKAALGRR